MRILLFHCHSLLLLGVGKLIFTKEFPCVMESAGLLCFCQSCSFDIIPSSMSSVPSLTHYVCEVYVNIILLFICGYFKDSFPSDLVKIFYVFHISPTFFLSLCYL